MRNLAPALLGALTACGGLPTEAPTDGGPGGTLSVAIYAPLPGATFRRDAGTIVVEAIVVSSAAPLQSTTLAVDGQVLNSGQDPGTPPTWILPATEYPAGEHLLTVTATDARQATASSDRDVILTN
jgi:hypothetical protein